MKKEKKNDFKDFSINGAKFNHYEFIVICPCCNLENYVPKPKYYEALDCSYCKRPIWDANLFKSEIE